MKLIQIDLRNFRLLQNVSIRMNETQHTTILVGPNNSGKTSVAEALLLFLAASDKRFSIYDFSSASRRDFEEVQRIIIKGKNDDKIAPLLPTMSMDLHFEYRVDNPDLAVASHFLMDLNPKSALVRLRIEYAVKDAQQLAHDFREARERKGHDGDILFDFLSAHLNEYYATFLFKTDTTGNERVLLEDAKVLDRLIRVDFVFAQRYVDDQESSRATRLSHLLHAHYEKHYKNDEPEGHEEIERSLKEHADDLGRKYMKAFDGLIKSLRQFGYPQRRAPSMSIRAELNPNTLFRDNTRIYYGTDPDATSLPETAEASPERTAVNYELPEKYNGLGYKNLIYMVLQIQSFRVALDRMPSDRPRVHLIFIEEPECHLHPQVQSVFIRHISEFLNRNGEGADAQIILTTHSSHIVSDCGFTPIRYFRRKNGSVDIKDLLDFERQTDTSDTIRFLSKYMSLMRCDLFFADKAILVEGQVERLLLPKMIVEYAGKGHPEFGSEYITIMEVGGAHAHKFQSLLKFIEIPTLVITDLDSVDADGKACPVAAGIKTSNETLKSWLPRKSTLADLKKVKPGIKQDGFIRVTYQIPENGKLPCGRSFEEAFVYRNAEWLLAHRNELKAEGYLFNQKSPQALIAGAYELKVNKVGFALDLLLAEGWETPHYIAQGLEWLADMGVS
jgi:predicted ATP-dependent endonuclease of OLD family